MTEIEAVLSIGGITVSAVTALVIAHWKEHRGLHDKIDEVHHSLRDRLDQVWKHMRSPD